MKDAIKLLAEQLTNKNQIIKAKANSVFEFIDLCKHDSEKITEISKEISVKLNNEIELFRGKLVPLMLEIEDLIKKNVEKYTPETESSKYNVIEFDMPIVINNLKSSGLLPVKFREARRLQEEQLYIPVIERLDLEKYLELDNPTATDGLRTQLGKYSDEDLLKIWDTYLTNISSTNVELGKLLSDPVVNIEVILVLYTYCHNLLKTKPSGVAANDDKYYGILKYFEEELANLIVYADSIFSSGRAKGRLVIGYTNEGYNVLVDEKLYQTFIDQGNSPEILLGLAVSDNKNDVDYIFFDKIVENREHLLGIWNNKLKVEHYAESVKTVTTYKSVYSIIMPEAYNLVPDDIKDILLVSEGEARTKLIEKLQTEKESEIIDPCYMAREIVGYVLFENTGFHKFTHYCMEIEKMNPDFDSKEIYNFATVQMLLDYLTDQIVIENA